MRIYSLNLWMVLGMVLGFILAFTAVQPAYASHHKLSLPLGKFRNTYYYVVLENEYEGQPKTTPVLDMNGQVLAQVSKAFKDAMDIEGTGRLVDGRVLNFAGVKDHEIRYRISQNPYGDGIGTCLLVPFHTIAVDSRKIPLGSLVRIKQTIGMELPDGKIHDGLWRADDIGGAIKGDRIDLFVGDGNQGRVLTKKGIRNLMPLDIEMVEMPKPDSCVHRSLDEQ